MPLVGQLGRHRRVTRQGQHQTHAPMAEIGKADHPAPPDTQHFSDQRRRLINLLEGLGQNHEVEGVVRIIPNFLVDVPLQHGKALLDTAGHTIFVDVDAGALGMLVDFQVMQQRTVAAAQAQDAGAFGDPGCHQTQIITNAVAGFTRRCHLPEIPS